MTFFEVGQKVKFISKYSDANNSEYVIVKIMEGVDETRIEISPLNSRLAIPPIYTVNSKDLVWIK